MATVPRAPSRPLMRLRRSPAWLAFGVVAVCLGGLLSAFVYLNAVESHPVLRVNRTVYRGETIAPGDLSVVQVGAGLDVRTVADVRADEVIGRAALTDVPAGSLLVEGSWGEASQPVGMARVGVRLSAGRYPAGDLRPGTPFLVVALPDPAAEQAELPASVPATLVAAPAAQPDGSLAFDLYVPIGQAEQVSRLASADRVALVQQGTNR